MVPFIPRKGAGRELWVKATNQHITGITAGAYNIVKMAICWMRKHNILMSKRINPNSGHNMINHVDTT